MRILIAGVTGYLGKRLAEKFMLFMGGGGINTILLLVRDKNRLSENLQCGNNISICEIYGESLEKRIKEFSPDVVYCTTCCYETDSEYLLKTIDANYVFPSQILRIIAGLKIKPVRFISVGTSLPPSLNLYSLTKKQFAELGIFFHKKAKINFFNLLLESFYGIDEPKQRFITRSILQLKSNQDLLLTEGTQKRDYIFIDDVVEIMYFLSSCVINRDICDIPVGTGIAPAIKEIIEFLYRETGSKSNLRFGAIEKREHEPSTVANIAILRQLGYSNPLIHWQHGMRKLVEALK
ncbi:MAG: NAD-dependent epimerase/dehydratase [Bacteroidales bacterium]|jgi:CDP-paratose synthetase|nr:NAD-dependent epimerase/dehydratase [Bacteroidales bacterium]